MSDLPPTVRAFIAVCIPDGIIARLTVFQQQLKSEFGNVSWTRPAALHVTLQFLGEVKSANLPRLARELSHIKEQVAGFDLELSDVGCFGNRVLWVGIGAGSDSLRRLAHAVRAVTSGFGAHAEKREFNAHVTLGRLREPARGVSAALRQHTPPRFGSWRVDHLELIRSELSPKGSRYTTLETFPLLRAE